ncbi:Enoyl-CoA hydratase [Hoyosella subflava DQS3-9A1]|uniref:Enoyl-CoA hydratase n=2 Tax=Hoyosella TaxID=697025 RepID=F6ES08_HOYSD|nr:Enoyl-CoA hydratase [Hoyosella subflava DQS3-9A1]
MLCNQITVAAENAQFIQYEVSRGLFPFGGGTVRWPLAAGTHNAYRYMLTGEPFDAAEAHRIGIVQQVVLATECLPAAIEMAQKIAMQAPLGVQAVLRNTRLAEARGSDAALGRLRREIVKIFLSKDIRRGLKAFQERRPARFEGN